MRPLRNDYLGVYPHSSLLSLLSNLESVLQVGNSMRQSPYFHLFFRYRPTIIFIIFSTFTRYFLCIIKGWSEKRLSYGENPLTSLMITNFCCCCEYMHNYFRIQLRWLHQSWWILLNSPVTRPIILAPVQQFSSVLLQSILQSFRRSVSTYKEVQNNLERLYIKIYSS